MGSKYLFGENVFSDIFMYTILNRFDLNDQEVQDNLKNNIENILLEINIDPDDLKFLDYNINIDDVYHKIIPNNIVTAMWLSGFIFNDIKKIYVENSFTYKDKIYSFNKKTKELTWKKIK